MAPLNQKATTKGFETPDERRDFRAHGHLDLVNFGPDAVIGRAIFEPGWRWSSDVKPIAGTESCEAEHLGYCLRGRMVIKMNSGEELRIGPGQAFFLPSGHDAWVEGDEPCELLDFGGFKEYAKKQDTSKAA